MATNNRIKAPDSKHALRKLVIPITHRNEKAGQLASRTLVHHSTFQR
jgi:hypothetical protein